MRKLSTRSIRLLIPYRYLYYVFNIEIGLSSMFIYLSLLLFLRLLYLCPYFLLCAIYTVRVLMYLLLAKAVSRSRGGRRSVLVKGGSRLVSVFEVEGADSRRVLG